MSAAVTEDSIATEARVEPPTDAGRSSGAAPPDSRQLGGQSTEPLRERLLRARLRVFLFGRLLAVVVFLVAVVAIRAFAPQTDEPIHRAATLYGALVAFGLALASAAAVRRVRALVAFAQLQSIADVVLLTGAIAAVWRGVPPSAGLLYGLAIANAACLLLRRGATITALVAAIAYGGLLEHGFAIDPAGPWLDTVGVPAGIGAFLMLGTAAMVGALAERVANAEEALSERDEEVGRLEGVQRALANDLECGVLVADISGRVRSANPAAQQILGLPASAALGREIHWLVPTLANAEQDGGEAGFAECDVRAGDGSTRRLRVKRTPLADTYGNPAGELVLLQDMTRLLELEERLLRGDDVGLIVADGPAFDAGDEARDGEPVDGMIGSCPGMRTVAKLIDKVAQTDATVLVTGESGTGKELVARAVHRRSGRATAPFVVVNCGAIPENLIESELFGHVRGAFTGAIADRPGLFRRAHGGTIFLDEIGELPLHLQVRLLRVLQDHLVMPVGGNTQVPVDVRVIAATNRVLEDLVRKGQFREDLYYRLAVIAVPLPPVRERGRDIERLIAHFVRRAAERHAKKVTGVSARAMHLLLRYPYPGNVRELENVIEHATTLCEGETIREAELPESVRESARQRGAPLSAAAARSSPPAASAEQPRPGAADDPGGGAPSWSGTAPEGPPIDYGEDSWSPLLLPIDEGEGANLDDQLARREKALLLAALARADGVKKKAATFLGINYRSFRHRLQKYGLDSHGVEIEPSFDGLSLPRERGH